VHLHPRVVKKIFRHNLQGKFVIASPGHEVHPPKQSKSQFLGHFLLGGLDLEVYLVVLDRSLRATTKEKVVNFFEDKKCIPQTEL